MPRTGDDKSSGFGKRKTGDRQSSASSKKQATSGPVRETRGVLGLTLAVVSLLGAALYYFYPAWFTLNFAPFSWKSLTSPTSIVAAECERDWIARASNDAAIMCYLQKDPKRLCDPAERVSLAAAWDHYRKDGAAFADDIEAHNKRYLALMGGKYLEESNRVLQENMKILMQNPPFEERERLQKRVNDLVLRAQDEAYENREQRKAAQAKRVSTEDLIAALRALGREGYMKPSDFNDPSDKLISLAFEGIAMKINVCGEGPQSIILPPPIPQKDNEPGILVVDLTGRGLNSTELFGSKVQFLYEGEHAPVRTAWLGSGAAFLVHFKGQQEICDAQNLFGSVKRSGLDELAAYDDNHDGVIDKDDHVYRELKVWEDSNADGFCQRGELQTLEQARLSSINLHNLLEKPGRTPQGNLLTSWSGGFVGGEKTGVIQIQFPTDPNEN